MWNLSPTPAPLGLGCDSHFVFLCRSVFTKNNTVPHTQVTRADHTIKVCFEGITDRSLARFGAVIPRGDNQSTRGMDLLVVSQLRFLGPVPFHTTAFPGQFPLAQLPLGDRTPITSVRFNSIRLVAFPKITRQEWMFRHMTTVRNLWSHVFFQPHNQKSIHSEPCTYYMPILRRAC